MTYQEVLEQARGAMGPLLQGLSVCNGLACRNTVPGPGAKGIGTGFIRNYQKWQELCVNMDTICENKPVDTSFTLFGRTVDLPVFAAPVGAMTLHYGDKYNDLAYNDILVAACAEAGIAAFTGDGTDPAVMEAARRHRQERRRRAHRQALEPGDHPAEDGPGEGRRSLCHRHGHRRGGPALPEEHDAPRRQQDCGGAARDRCHGGEALHRQGHHDRGRGQESSGGRGQGASWCPTTAAGCWISAPLPQRSCPPSWTLWAAG